jgi:hypothetical protein
MFLEKFAEYLVTEFHASILPLNARMKSSFVKRDFIQLHGRLSKASSGVRLWTLIGWCYRSPDENVNFWAGCVVGYVRMLYLFIYMKGF